MFVWQDESGDLMTRGSQCTGLVDNTKLGHTATGHGYGCYDIVALWKSEQPPNYLLLAIMIHSHKSDNITFAKDIKRSSTYTISVYCKRNTIHYFRGIIVLL